MCTDTFVYLNSSVQNKVDYSSLVLEFWRLVYFMVFLSTGWQSYVKGSKGKANPLAFLITKR